MQSFLGNFQGKVHLGFKLDGEDTRKTVSLRRPGVPSDTAGMPLFLGGGGGGGLEDRVAGALMVMLRAWSMKFPPKHCAPSCPPLTA